MSKRAVDFRAFRIKRKRVYLPETDEELHDENERRVDEMERELKQEKEEKQRLKELQEKKEEERRARMNHESLARQIMLAQNKYGPADEALEGVDYDESSWIDIDS